MRRRLSLLFVVLALGIVAPNAAAQTSATSLELRLAKVNGFSLGGRIQGRFRLIASGPADLSRVTFLIDGAPIGEASTSPFRITFDTGTYGLGRHLLSAVATSASGETLESDVLTVEFVSSDEARRSTLQLVGPVLAIVLLVSIMAVVGPLLVPGDRRRRGIGEYGVAGGAVCRYCGRPFSRSIFSPNLLGRRLERCPNCGKWSLAARASAEQLAEAEARQRGQQTRPSAPSDGDSLRRQIDNSRFED